jgi:hypothetical protein
LKLGKEKKINNMLINKKETEKLVEEERKDITAPE